MPNELDLLNDPDCSHLALGISTFLKKLTETDPICLTSYLRDRLGGALGSKIPWITATVMQGIKKAGLLKVLNNPQFTIQQLVASAVLDCSYEGAQKQAGIYFRFYSAPNTNQSGPRKDCSLYVGQSWDLHARCKRWISGELHKKLRGRADSIQMRALCPLDSVFYDDHKFIIEQLFTSLLQTYREDALEGIVDAEDHIGGSHQKNHADLVEIATAASKESSWTGAVQRESFWKGSMLPVQASTTSARSPNPTTMSHSYGFEQMDIFRIRTSNPTRSLSRTSPA